MEWDDVDARLWERTLTRLREALPTHQLDIRNWTNDDQIVRLPNVSGADYSFELWIYGPSSGGSGGRHIGAILPGRPSNESFWGCPFEPDSFFRTRSTTWAEAREHLADKFDEMVLHLIRLPTRIIQRRGLVNWKFAFEVQMPSGAWVRQDTCYMFRLGCRVPPVEGREKVYSSPAIVPLR